MSNVLGLVVPKYAAPAEWDLDKVNPSLSAYPGLTVPRTGLYVSSQAELDALVGFSVTAVHPLVFLDLPPMGFSDARVNNPNSYYPTPALIADWLARADAQITAAVGTGTGLDASVAAQILAAGSSTKTALDAHYAALTSVSSGAFYNVKDHGAKGDGTTVDTTSINTAIATLGALGAGVVYFPPGTYLLDPGIDVGYSNITLMGSGQSTILKRKAASGSIDTRVIAANQPINGSVSTATGVYLSNIHVRDMLLDGNGLNVTSTKNSTFVQGTVQLFQCKNSTVENVYVLNPRDVGILLFACQYSDVVGSTVDGMQADFQCNSIMVVGDATGGTTGSTDPNSNVRPSNYIRVDRCRVVKNWWVNGDNGTGYFTGNGIAINVQGSSDVTVIGCSVDLSGEPANRGRNGSGIMFEAGGTPASFGLLKRCVAIGNQVKYTNNGIQAITTSGGANDVTGNIIGVTFTGNTVYDAIIGIFSCGSRVSIGNNIIYAGRAIRLGNSDTSHEEDMAVSGNIIRLSPNSQLYGVSGNKSSVGGYLKGVTVTNNVIDGTELTTITGNPAGISFTGEVNTFLIANNVLRNLPGNGVRLDPVSSTDNTQPRPRDGRVMNNDLVNVCNVPTATFPNYYGICSTGTDNVLCMFNKIIGSGTGNSSYRDTTSENTGVMTIFGNLKDGNAVATDNGNKSNRIGGTLTGAKAGNTALTSVIASLVGTQYAKDTTT